VIPDLYSSFNDALTAVWGTLAPGKPFVLGHPDAPARLPPECLRVYWLNHGGATDQANEIRAVVQVDVFVPGNNRVLALSRAQALESAMGFNRAPGYGRLGVVLTDSDPVEFIGEARVAPFEDGWVDVEDPVPGVVHLARTLELYATPLTP
jgi:hypothetical protein